VQLQYVQAFSLDASSFAALEVPFHASGYSYPVMW
jgi:hypothetical protein